MPEKTFLINSQYGHSLSSDGSTFAMNLQPPLVLPKDSEPLIEVVEATAWHVAENIKTGVNDVFKASFANISGNAVQTMTFPPACAHKRGPIPRRIHHSYDSERDRAHQLPCLGQNGKML